MMIGEINQENLYLLLPSKVSWMADMITTNSKVGLIDAIREVYSSDTYRQMEIEETKLWHLGPVDLYNDITEERGKR